jgi:DNA repair protein RadC
MYWWKIPFPEKAFLRLCTQRVHNQVIGFVFYLLPIDYLPTRKWAPFPWNQPRLPFMNLPASPQNPPHYHGHRQRLRDRFLKSGFSGLAEHEVLEILLTLIIPRKDVKEPAKDLLSRFGNLYGVLNAPLKKLQEIRNIGVVAPVAFRIIREAAGLFLQQAAERSTPLNSFDSLSAFWRVRLGDLSHEVFEVAYLDSAYQLMVDGVERLEEGTIDRAAVYPRKIMAAALKRGAAALVLAHNHTNRDVRPSEQDKLLTRSLVLAASTLQVIIYDHLIVSSEAVFSFRREGLL